MLKTLTRLTKAENGAYRLFVLFRKNYGSAATIRNVHTSCSTLAKAKRSASQAQRHDELERLVTEDTNYMEMQKTSVLKTFPQVKGTINNMFNHLANNMDSSYRCENKNIAIGRIKNQVVFQCSLYITWPKSATFYGYGFKKKFAELAAYTKLAEALHKDELMTSSGQPVTMSRENRQSMLADLNKPLPISLSASVMEKCWNLLDQYDVEIAPLLKGYKEPGNIKHSGIMEDSEGEHEFYSADERDVDEEYQYWLEEDDKQPQDLITGRALNLDPGSNEQRSTWLLRRMENRSNANRVVSPALPIEEFRESIENAFCEKRILILCGDTGCGKSTQVPQMILDKWIREERGAECNIVVTQPRRISAISIAKRVAQERAERIGESIGYQVQLQYAPVKNRGGIMFCTSGMLLQKLHSNPTLEGISHIVLDEVHERSIYEDLLLILIRRVMKQQPHLKLVLMSASLSINQLTQYFGEDNVKVINVPGTIFPLTRRFLPDALNTLGLKPQQYDLQKLLHQESDLCPFVNVDLVTDVIKGIDSTRPPGAILCFLPGWQDIFQVQTKLTESTGMSERLWVLPLHSRLAIKDQELIFQRPPEGKRKVVLTTNIAETSLTVDDVVYVVDTGFHKEQRYNSRKDVTVLGNHWISQANSQQRAGRAGRVQPGEVFHLYSKEIHEDMDKYPLPEILKIPLEHVILQSKGHCGEESVLNFLSEGLSVPSRRFISAALNTLENLGMLHSDHRRQSETLTALGERAVYFPTPPHLSKALIYSSIFRCVDAVLAISASVNSGHGVFFTSIDTRSQTREAKMKVDPSSDLLATYHLMRQWQQYSSYEDVLAFCTAHNLNYKSLRFNEGIKKVYGNYLRDALLVDEVNTNWSESPWSINSTNGQLVLGVLLAGVNRTLHLHRGTYSKGIMNTNSFTIRTKKGHSISTVSDCVLHQLPLKTPPRDGLPRHLLCVNITREEASQRTVARDLSFLHPLTVTLFAGTSVSMNHSSEGTSISVDDEPQLSFLVDENTGMFLEKLRSVMDHIISHEIETRGFSVNPQPVDFFIRKLVGYVSQLLSTSNTVTEMREAESKESRDLW